MSAETIKKALSYILVAALLVATLIFTGTWIPKVGFMPEKLRLTAGDATVEGERGLLIDNSRIFILSEVIVDLNGKPWSEGYTTRFGEINAKSMGNWVSLSDFKKDGLTFPADGKIDKIEIYGLAHGQKFYSKIIAASIRR